MNWRSQPLAEMSVPQWETLAAEGHEEAKEHLRRWNARQRDYWSPMATTPRLGWFDGDGA